MKSHEIEKLVTKIENRSVKIGIVGLGYTGLPLALLFAKKFCVIGYDYTESKVKMLLKGISYIGDIKENILKKYLNKTFFPTNNHEKLIGCDFFIICVPTPLTEEKEPDLSYVKNACETITRILTKGAFVILESTTYPGTTEEIVVPILEKSGLRADEDFGVAYSPERIDPGSKEYGIEKTPRVVGGISQECTEIAVMLYKNVINKVIKVKDCKTAEATKMIENIFRNVNIALVNELSLIFERMGINVWDVIEAASTKPFGFMPFYPGPGVGGHCIPLDPYYLSYKAKKFGFIPRFIELSGEINDFMKMHVVDLVKKGLKAVGKKIPGSNIAVMGLAYKRGVADTREAPAKTIIDELLNLGAKIKVYDPYARLIETRRGRFYSEKDIEGALSDVDCAVFVIDHAVFKTIDISMMKKLVKSKVIIDCKNIFNENQMDNFVYLGLGKYRENI